MAAEEILRLKAAGVLCPHCELKHVQDKCCQEFCGDAYDNYLNAKDDMRVEAEVLNKNNDELPKYPEGWQPIPIVAPDKTILYVCDPELNVNCKKSECRERGGDCYATKDVAYAKRRPIMGCRVPELFNLNPQGVQKCEPTDQCYEVTAEGELMYEEGETVIVPKDEYRQLVFNAHLVDCLEEMGVDNWQGYGDAYKMAEERMKDFDSPSEDVVDLPEDYWEDKATCNHRDEQGKPTLAYESPVEMRSSDMFCTQCMKSGSKQELIGED